ncbi:hypothetical protein ACJIZ3_005516 [Penstemon smallii]|uniref:Vacuolar amino acid transporter YPQ3 n=1 Tax=Penstemon smallii TaxID=265156 RepID=A0ABD3S595_9LAMI
MRCPIDRKCLQWARKYMGYCVCSTRDGFSMGLGMLSVISWGVAEIPQIITNFKHKSAKGISLAFLFTWIVGDFLNLFGCMLEPTTLPTQYYMAVLYLATTIILTAQAIYYGYIYPRFKSNKRSCEAMQAGAVDRKRDQNHAIDAEKVDNAERCEVTPSSPIPLPANSRYSLREDLYFMSARSLSVSSTPTLGSFPAQKTPTADVENHWFREPLLDEVRFSQSAPPPKMKTMLCVVFLMTFLIGSFNRQLEESRKNNMIYKNPTGGIVYQVGRRLLQATIVSGQETLTAKSGGIGSYLGWGMTVIYLGGRLPQIFLNIRKGNAEGLNPLMFVFAILGNTTYVAR